MGTKTGISWTESTWNAARGCTRVDQGCVNCYAESVAHRFGGPGQPYEGLTVVQSNGEPRWNGKVTLVEKHLLDPLRWQKPRKIFVNSMSDFFHPAIPDEWRDKQMAVMALAYSRGHVFQLLTKREGEMLAYLTAPGLIDRISGAINWVTRGKQSNAQEFLRRIWPLPNLWLLVSVNDQASADKRIPVLLRTPAAIRGVSAEPLTGPVDFDGDIYSSSGWLRGWHCEPYFDGEQQCPSQVQNEKLDWVIIGGESGHGARPFNIQWARDIIGQCKAANVAAYMKQLGSNPYCVIPGTKHTTAPIGCGTGKRDNPEEWFEDLRVQEYPNGAGAGNP